VSPAHCLHKQEYGFNRKGLWVIYNSDIANGCREYKMTGDVALFSSRIIQVHGEVFLGYCFHQTETVSTV